MKVHFETPLVKLAVFASFALTWIILKWSCTHIQSSDILIKQLLYRHHCKLKFWSDKKIFEDGTFNGHFLD